MANRRLKVAIVTYAMYGGGMERSMLILGQQLNARGFEVDIVTEERTGAWYHQIRKWGMGSRHVDGWQAHHALSHALRVGRVLSEGCYDVVLLNHAHFAQSTLSILADHVAAIPIIHLGLPSMYRVACASPSLWNVAVAVSPKLQAEAEERVRARRPIVCIPHGTVLPSDGAWLSRRSYEGEFELCYVGRIHEPHKGVFLLATILARCLSEGLESARLSVVGDGPDLAELKRRIDAEGLSDRVAFLGDVEPERVMPHLLRAHALLMPSWYEGLGNVVLEAQACGCVPIASRILGVTDMTVDEGQTGFLVEPGDAEGFVESIRTLYHDRARCARMGAAGHERMRASFSVEAMGDAYERLIRDALAGKYPLPRSRKRGVPIDLSLFKWTELLPTPVRRLGRRVRPHLQRK